MTEPVPPAVPIWPMMARMMSLAVAPWRQLAVHLDQHVLGLLLDQCLGREHMLDLRRADAMGERAEGAMRRSMAVAAHDGRAGQGEALFGPDHMHDALAAVMLVEILDAEFLGILGERFDLGAAFGLGDALGAIGGRHIVVDDGQRLFRMAHLAAGHAQAFESLRARHLMDEMAVDIEEAGAVLGLVDQMIVPDLVVKRARLHPLPRMSMCCGALFRPPRAGERKRFRRIGIVLRGHGGAGLAGRGAGIFPPQSHVSFAPARHGGTSQLFFE